MLAGKYRIESKLGAGAFGVVYRATHMALDHPVAVKILQHNVLLSDDRSDALARFRREGISTCRVNHPNAVTVIDFGVTDNGVAYLVMELLEGKTLAESLKENGTFSPSRCLEILAPICSVLEEAHASGVVHRDIKPANIFLHGIRGEEIVKVLDFGIAKLVGSASDEHATMTMEGSLLGTPAYMAPERVANKVYDGRADVYSVGVMLYQMLVGHPPFKAQDPVALAVQQMNATPPPPRDINPDMPPAVEAVVLEALVKDPDLRPTAALLAQRFASAVAISQSPDSHEARTTAGLEDPTNRRLHRPQTELVATRHVGRVLCRPVRRATRQSLRQQRRNLPQQPIEFHRLGVVIVAACLEGLPPVPGHRVRRDRDDGIRRLPGPPSSAA